MTQTNSKPRVKQDAIGDNQMKKLFELFTTASTEDFRKACQEVIVMSSAKSTTKAKFNEIVTKTSSKSSMLTTVTNFFLAGEGRGV